MNQKLPSYMAQKRQKMDPVARGSVAEKWLALPLTLTKKAKCPRANAAKVNVVAKNKQDTLHHVDSVHLLTRFLSDQSGKTKH